MEIRITAPGIECKTRFTDIADMVIIKLIKEICLRRPNDVVVIQKEYEDNTEIRINEGMILVCHAGKVKKYFPSDAERVSYNIIYKTEQSENI